MLYCNSTKYGAWIIQSEGWFNKTQKLHDINCWYKGVCLEPVNPHYISARMKREWLHC